MREVLMIMRKDSKKKLPAVRTVHTWHNKHILSFSLASKAIYNVTHAIPHHGAIRRKVAVENFIIYETLAPRRIFEQAAGRNIPPPLKYNTQNTAKCIDGARGALELDPILPATANNP